jgi:hypothetical protein
MPRPKEEHAPEGYLTTAEAGELMKRSRQTVRNMIKDGRLEGGPFTDEDANEVRYYAKKDAVKAWVEGRGKQITPGASLAVQNDAEELAEWLQDSVQVNRQVVREVGAELQKGQEQTRAVLGEVLDQTQQVNTLVAAILQAEESRAKAFRNSRNIMAAIVACAILLVVLMAVMIVLEIVIP